MTMWRNRIIFALAFCGIGVSLYALSQHYSDGPSFCDISERFSCEVVNRGPWSELFGIPVALMGVIGYAAIAIISWARHKKKEILLVVFVAGGLLFSAYLTYLEAFVIFMWCPICIGSAGIMSALGIAVAAPYVTARSRRKA